MGMRVWTRDDKAIVNCHFNEKEFVKAIGDYKYDKESKCWIFPLRKLIDIIDNLKVTYDQETTEVYDRLRVERKERHERLNLANKIKTSIVPPPNDRLYEHQRQAVEIGKLFDSYAMFMETGTGKTLVAIELMKFFGGKSMVVTPLSTIESVWKKEIVKWSDLKAVSLWKSLDDIYKDHADVFLINYEQFKILHKKNGKAIEDRINTIIIDESSKMKNPKSDITKTILYYRRKIAHRFCLSGTPAPNNLLEYWGQITFINDEILPDSFYKYRAKYFYSTGYGGYQYRPCKGAKESIMETISRQAYSVRKQDCLDLPERVYEVRSIVMDDVQRTAYEEMKELNVLEYDGNVVLSANELAKIMKLRQVTAGFIINNDGIPVLISDSKMNTLKELLEEIPEDQQVIVWCQFHFEIERIKKEYGDETTSTLYGLMSQKEKTKAIHDFMEGNKRILIAHPKTGGMGLNFQKNCSYMVWYSLSYSQEEYSQACDRIYRSGQTNRCTYYILSAEKSVDEIIYKALKGKANLMESCLEMLKKGEV